VSHHHLRYVGISCTATSFMLVLTMNRPSFPVTGNVSSFQPEDRRDWVQNLLAAAKVEETQEEKDIKEAARMAAERWGHGAALGGEDDQQDDLLARVPAPMLGTLDKERTMKRLDSSSALITVDGAESAISWRVRLMQLRALNSDAGNSSGAYPSVCLYTHWFVFGAVLCEHCVPRCTFFVQHRCSSACGLSSWC
jgi:hypothetical protein